MTTKMTMIGMLTAVTMAVGMSTNAQALTYVNLLDEPAPRVGGNFQPTPRVNPNPNPQVNSNVTLLPEPLPEPGDGPVSVSWGANSGQPQAMVSSPQTAAQQAAAFNQWAVQMLQARQTADQQMRQSVAQCDQVIYQQWVTREQARADYVHTGSEAYRQAFFAAQANIERYQQLRWNALTTYTTYIYNNINQLYAYDPNKTANLSWYQGQIAANQNFYNVALAQAQADYGYAGEKYQQVKFTMR